MSLKLQVACIYPRKELLKAHGEDSEPNIRHAPEVVRGLGANFRPLD
jgi:hypothetical protein